MVAERLWWLLGCSWDLSLTLHSHSCHRLLMICAQLEVLVVKLIHACGVVGSSELPFLVVTTFLGLIPFRCWPLLDHLPSAINPASLLYSIDGNCLLTVIEGA